MFLSVIVDLVLARVNDNDHLLACSLSGRFRFGTHHLDGHGILIRSLNRRDYHFTRSNSGNQTVVIHSGYIFIGAEPCQVIPFRIGQLNSGAYRKNGSFGFHFQQIPVLDILLRCQGSRSIIFLCRDHRHDLKHQQECQQICG